MHVEIIMNNCFYYTQLLTISPPPDAIPVATLMTPQIDPILEPN